MLIKPNKINMQLRKYLPVKYKDVFIHGLIGVFAGYFIVHPVSMVIYWFNQHESSYTIPKLWDVFTENIQHSFAFHMMPMSVAFSVLGLVGGVISGVYYKKLREKESKLQGKRQLLKQSIPTLIANGETNFVEFKSSLRHDYRQIKTDKNLELVILKSIAGFMNSNGGILIIGVNDFGEILGLENDYWSLRKKNKDGFQQRLLMLVSNAFGKHICSFIQISFHVIGNREICTITIEPANQPIYIKEGDRTIFYLRTGNVTNPLNTSETVKYLASKKYL